MAACGQGDQPVRLAAQEFRFSPSVVRLRADAPARLTIVNEGRETHEFTGSLLTDSRVRVLSAPDTFRLPPGSSITLRFQAPPGAYPFQCRVRGHAGMEGLVIVES
jgi:plastocyanin